MTLINKKQESVFRCFVWDSCFFMKFFKFSQGQCKENFICRVLRLSDIIKEIKMQTAGGSEVRKQIGGEGVKRVLFVLAITALFLMSACVKQSEQALVSQELGIEVSGCEEISSIDNHGGFHGDGIEFVTLRCPDENVLNQIRHDSGWKSFPMDDTATAIVYGLSDETKKMGPFVADDEGNPLVPEIENGYYILIDRQAGDGKTEKTEILGRASFNFTLGVYDADTDILYYCELDT